MKPIFHRGPSFLSALHPHCTMHDARLLMSIKTSVHKRRFHPSRSSTTFLPRPSRALHRICFRACHRLRLTRVEGKLISKIPTNLLAMRVQSDYAVLLNDALSFVDSVFVRYWFRRCANVVHYDGSSVFDACFEHGCNDDC